MREVRELKEIVADTIRASGGTAPFVIAAKSEAEAGVIRGLLKGKHGARVISVEVKPESYWISWASEWASTPHKAGPIWGGREKS